MNNTPRLFRVHNMNTQEVYTLFAKSKSQAVSLLPLDPNDEYDVEEVKTLAGDGGLHCIYMLKDVTPGPSGMFFRTVNCNTLNVGKTVWLKKNGDYDRSIKKYCCTAAEDICKSRGFKPTQWVITTFTY